MMKSARLDHVSKSRVLFLWLFGAKLRHAFERRMRETAVAGLLQPEPVPQPPRLGKLEELKAHSWTKVPGAGRYW